MATVRDLITSSARLINVLQKGEVLDNDDVNVAIFALTAMTDEWSNDPSLIYSRQFYTFQTVAGQQVYTLGTGGDWNTPRPMNINMAFVELNTTDPINTLTRELKVAVDMEYARIPLKNMQMGFPLELYDDGNYPLRNIYLWPVPTEIHNIKLWLYPPLIDMTDIDADVTFPLGYLNAFRYNLAVALAPEFGKDITDAVIGEAKRSKAELKRQNSNRIPLYNNPELTSTYDKMYGVVSYPQGLVGDTV